MFVNFSEETKHLLKQAEKEKDLLNHPYVGTEHLLLSFLKDEKAKEVFEKHNLTYSKFRNRLISLVGVGTKKTDLILYTPLLKRIIENAVIEAREENLKNVTPLMLIISILDEEDGIAYSIIKSLKINIEKLYSDIKSRKNNKNPKIKKLLLEELGVDLVSQARKNKLDPIIGRTNEIKRTIEILLRRKKNNPILIGPAGVGKTAIVEGIANLITSDNCPTFLKDKKIIALNIFEIVSGTKYRGEFEEKMKVLIKELEQNDNIILFIDEIHTIVGAGGAEGAIDASNIFKPALARGKIKIIGATTTEEYNKIIEPDAALSRRFQKVFIEEPQKDDLINILLKIKPLYEKHHNVSISDELINEIVSLSKKYLTNRFEPDRSIDILDEVCAMVSNTKSKNEIKKEQLKTKIIKINNEKINALSKGDFNKACEMKKLQNSLKDKLSLISLKEKRVKKEDVLKIIRNKSNISEKYFSDNKNAFYNKFEKKLKDNIFGQDENIKKLVMDFKKKDLLNKKECYSVLINGAESSGKELLATTYLNYIFNDNNVIKIDGSDYFESYTISKLIGTTAGYLGYDNKNHIFEKIRLKPSMGIIIENYDDACLEFKNLFSKILEHGYIYDASDKKIDFTNCIIIFINKELDSNNYLGFNSVNNGDTTQITNKVSISVNMNKPSDAVIKKIIDKKLEKITNKYDHVIIKCNDDVKKSIFKKVKKEGLTSLKKIIEDEYELKIIDKILQGKTNINIKIHEESNV